MASEHNTRFPAGRREDDIDAQDRTYIAAPITHSNHHGASPSDEISSRSIPETSIDPSTTHNPCSAHLAPAIPSSSQTCPIPTNSITHDSEYEKPPYNSFGEQPQVQVSTPSHHFHQYQETPKTPEDIERRYIEDLHRVRNAALSAECDQIEKQKIDTTIGSIHGLFGRGRHRDAWLIGCDTDATDFGGKTEGKIDARRNTLSSYGTRRDKMVGTIAGREKLAREQDVKINSLLSSRKWCSRRRMSASGGAGTISESSAAGRTMEANSLLEQTEASNGEEISVVRLTH